jgi:hypothetical protein
VGGGDANAIDMDAAAVRGRRSRTHRCVHDVKVAKICLLYCTVLFLSDFHAVLIAALRALAAISEGSLERMQGKYSTPDHLHISYITGFHHMIPCVHHACTFV